MVKKKSTQSIAAQSPSRSRLNKKTKSPTLPNSMALKPVLYYTPRSPPCRAVLLTAAEIGLELDLRTVNFKENDHLTPEFLKMNPQHTIPVLDDNGVIVSDSHVICAYLADKYAPDDTLYPRDLAKRREVDARLFFECGHLFPRVRFIVEPILYFGSDRIPDDRISYLQRAYDGLELCLMHSDGPYLCGKHLTIADLSCISSVSTAAIFAPIDADKFPKVTAWVQRLSELPYFDQWNQQAANLLEKLVKEKLVENKKAKSTAV